MDNNLVEDTKEAIAFLFGELDHKETVKQFLADPNFCTKLETIKNLSELLYKSLEQKHLELSKGKGS